MADPGRQTYPAYSTKFKCRNSTAGQSPGRVGQGPLASALSEHAQALAMAAWHVHVTLLHLIHCGGHSSRLWRSSFLGRRGGHADGTIKHSHAVGVNGRLSHLWQSWNTWGSPFHPWVDPRGVYQSLAYINLSTLWVPSLCWWTMGYALFLEVSWQFL